MRETNDLEFKSDISKTFLKTVSAFANYGTGKIIFGLTDDGSIVGVSNPIKTCLKIENMINDSIHPAPRFSLEPNMGNNTITLIVHEGLFKPYVYNGRAYKRNDTSTLPVDNLEYGRLVLTGQNITFDSLHSNEKDLSLTTLTRYLIETLGIQCVNNDIFKTLGLISSDGLYTNAAALLADTNSFVGVDIIKFGKDLNEIQARYDLSGQSILRQLEEGTEIFERYYLVELIDSLARQTVENIPNEAFREALTNALIHRTWDIDSKINVSMFDDRIEITSPGGLTAGISEEEYLSGNVSISRNPIITNIFFRLKLIEQFGTGVARIISSYSRTSKLPIFEIRANSIKVILPVLNTSYSMTKDESRIYELLDSEIIVSASEISKEAGFSKDKTIRLLNNLISEGLIRKSGSGRSTRYSK